ANPNISVQFVSLWRYDGLGRPLEAYATGGSLLSCGTTGSKRWQGTTLPPMLQPTAGDRLRVGFAFSRVIVDKSGFQISIGFGDPSRDYVQVPIAVGSPVIVWNGNTLGFPGPLTAYLPDIDADRDQA